ncbi:MAG: 4-hydroxythreonine-4-phosphate dehydrogenase PdxA [Chloroflexi bacterium]|nr:4-hydroxythreonine-4-phosphate dehydrogenase PdxA [Chloroflexota bacterium]|tara:strand:- start:7119 stop:8129 length:1011 start_codon:yes stop_codon:yes gene_type:complete
MNLNNKPNLGITMGDPSGIGPEVIAKSLSDDSIFFKCIPIIFGNSNIMSNALDSINSNKKVNPIDSINQAISDTTKLNVLDIGNLDYNDIQVGQVSDVSGKASVEWILKAGNLAASNEIQAIVTAPINKEACNLAGFKDVGHMEIFQSQTQSDQVATMLMARNLRVVHLTTHKSLKIACDYVTHSNILEKLILTDKYFTQWNIKNPKIGVSALNPHASDGGIIGNEEFDQILPAVNSAKEIGINAIGPIPADTIFNQAIDGAYDVVLAMYHDQGHIPIKAYDWARSVSVNIGLPFIRTSVDHGTAFDIAGKGLADPLSMLEAIKVAVSLIADNKLP